MVLATCVMASWKSRAWADQSTHLAGVQAFQGAATSVGVCFGDCLVQFYSQPRPGWWKDISLFPADGLLEDLRISSTAGQYGFPLRTPYASATRHLSAFITNAVSREQPAWLQLSFYLRSGEQYFLRLGRYTIPEHIFPFDPINALLANKDE